jgi:HlyD family secretion protein
MEAKSKRRAVAAVVVVMLALGLVALREWQGPRLPGYRVEFRPLVQIVVASGRVITVSRVQVGSEITGVVRERRVAEGDVVAPGDVLVVLRADDLLARVREAEAALQQLERATRPRAEVALREAQTRLAQAERESERRRGLFQRELIARELLEQAEEAEDLARAATEQARLAAASLAPGNSEERLLRERLAAARAALDKTVVRSEVAGVVLTRNAEPGDLVQPGRVLFDIARAGDTEILVPFDEENLARLALGQRATCLADAYPEQPFGARIHFIAPRVDPQRGTVDVRLKVDPVPAFLRQDMTVSVNVQTGRRERALVVPNDALFEVAGDAARVLAVRDGRVEPVAIRLGLRGLTATEVVAGLGAGDRVLAGSRAAAADGQRVRVIEQAFPTPAPAEAATRRETLMPVE